MAIDNTEDVIDSRDVIARIEQLQAIRLPGPVPAGVLEDEDYETDQDSLFAELASLEKLAAQGEGLADWIHGEGLIRDSYFTTYAQELAEDIGATGPDNQWPLYCIDWERAARELKVDYIDLDFDGVTYWTRG